MRKRRCLTLLAVLFLTAPSCKKPSGTTPTTPAVPAILQPYQGKWKFNLTKTLARWKADGVPDQEIGVAAAMSNTIPIHNDLSLTADTAILPGVVEGEYQFFALHPHGQIACGKAWHHEDRHDPGDMSKQLVRLEIRDADLHLHLRSEAAPPAMNDPDIANPPVTAGSAATCNADALPETAWSPWRVYIFDRK